METGDLLRPGAADASVRSAGGADVASIAAIQARAWRHAYAGLIPATILAALAADQLEPSWRRAVTQPPSAQHAVLVACSMDTVIGFAAVAPGTDPDLTEADGELVALEVDPAHQRSGHGSRLLAAAVDTLRERDFGILRAWCPVDDQARHDFLHSAGLRPDGARRGLRGDAGAEVAQQRMVAALLPRQP